MKMYKISLLLVGLVSLFLLGINSTYFSRTTNILIYSTLEDFRIKALEEQFKIRFPDKNIAIQYMDTGTIVSRLMSEGKGTDCDIFLGIEATNAHMLLNNSSELFEDLSKYPEYNTFRYDNSVLPSSDLSGFENGKISYHIWDKEAGSIILNIKYLKENNLPEPMSFEDLLNPIYKHSIMMPNPKTSGTGYYFLNGLVSAWGEEEALNYFGELNKNIKEFSTSGSGPVKALDRGEIGIGLGMNFQAVTYANNNPDLKIKYFEEGSPYSLYTMGVIKGKFAKPGVKEVYDYVFGVNDPANDPDNMDVGFTRLDKMMFDPEIIYKPEYTPTCLIPNYPDIYSIKYIDMKGIFSPEHKFALLDKWRF